MINFLLGQPSTDLLSTAIFSRAAQEAFAAPGAADRMLQYAEEKGNPLFLERLSKFLSSEYQDEVPVENLCATPGASLSVQHILSMLTRPASTTRFAFFQNPIYHLEYKIFSDVGFTEEQFVGVPEDSDGLCTHAFEEILQARFPDGPDTSADGFYSAVLYCVPTHANPSSTILSHARRVELVRLAREYNVLVICDDVYDILTFDQDPLPKRLVAYDLDDLREKTCGKPSVISNGSFSKILAPGSRAGWIEAHPDLVDKLGLCASFLSGGSPSTLSSEIISVMLDTKDPQLCLRRHIQGIRAALHERLHQGLWDPIQKHLTPLGCEASLPRGGYFVWLRLPDGMNFERLDKAIQELQLDISVGSGTLFAVPGQPAFHDCLRLCFAHYRPEELAYGVEKLAEAVKHAASHQ